MNRAGSYTPVTADGAAQEATRLQAQATLLWQREREALRALGLTSDLRILDVGCGAGTPLANIRRDFAPRLAVGIDTDRQNLERARQVVTAALASGAHLPFADGAFDLVLFRFVLRHVPDPRALLLEACRVLKPAGRIIAIDGDDATILLDPEPEGWPALRTVLDQSARLRGGDPCIGRRLRRLLLDVGLEEARASVVPVTTSDMSAAVFVEVFLAPAARPADQALISPAAAARAWEALRAWSGREEAFGCALGFFAGARKPG
jgi:SAM-dependent methyltransferase